MGDLFGPALDPVTLLFAISLLGFLMAAVSVSSARVLPKQAPALIEWGKAMAAGGGAFLCYYFRGHWPWFVSFFVGNALLMAFSYFGLTAHAKLFDVRFRVQWAGVVSASGMSGVFASYFWDVSRRAAVFTLSAAIALMFAATAVTILRTSGRRANPAALIAAMTFAAVSAAFAARALAALFSGGSFISPTSASPPQVGLMVTGTVFVAIASINFFATAQAQQRREIEDEARRDSLTGLFNRGALLQVAHELDANTNAGPYAVVMFDIDRFKSINDTFGHGGGDVALAHAARLIAGLARISDVVARYGGEEFCVLLLDGAEQEAAQFARRVVSEAAKQSVRLADGRTTSYTFSAGYAAKSGFARPDATKESIFEVLERADQALYQAKGAGRNQAVAAPAVSLVAA